jgi:hypothetical protein
MRPSTAALACVVASRRTAFAAAAVMSFVAFSTASLRRPSADEARVDHTAWERKRDRILDRINDRIASPRSV